MLIGKHPVLKMKYPDETMHNEPGFWRWMPYLTTM
jgi:hypothetical protein